MGLAWDVVNIRQTSLAFSDDPLGSLTPGTHGVESRTGAKLSVEHSTCVTGIGVG